jgi:hypothetical protein
MRDFLKRRVGRPSAGWLWALALLALPGCADIIGLEPWNPKNPFTTLVFCDIPTPPPDAPQCIAPGDIGIGIRQASAAVGLNTGDTNTITIDESATALAACAATTGGPQSVTFQGTFPQGIPTCADPSSITDATKVCVAFCSGGENPDPAAFCSANARASTNVPLTGFPGGCTTGGSPIPDFDPRKLPEEVVWDPDPANLIGVTPNGSDLQRTADTSPPANDPPFDAGAASTQRIERGDAYVEFSTATTAGETSLSHVIGLSEIADSCAAPCTDTDPSLTDINFAISLNKDGHVYVIESGVLNTTGPDINGSFRTYNPVERYRVSLRQSSDGSKTAIVTYSVLTAACVPGNPCQEDVFYTSAALGHYPLRVDTSFREVNAALSKVTVVRIQNP